MLKRAVAARKFRLSQISGDTAIHVPLDELISMYPSSEYHLLPAFAIPPVQRLRYFSEAVQDCADCHNDLTRRHRLCTAVEMKIAICVTEALVA